VYQTFLSWRYLLARRTNLIGIMGIMVGTGAMIMILAIMTGFLEESRSAVRGNLADLIIEPTAWFDRHLDVPTGASAVLDIARDDPRVVSACAHLTWGGMISREDHLGSVTSSHMRRASGRSLPVAQLIGIDVADEIETTDFEEHLRREPGEMRTLPTEEDEDGRVVFTGFPVADATRPFRAPAGWSGDEPWAWVVVGEQLAYQNSLRPGSVINVATVVISPEDGEVGQSNRKFLVAGTLRSGENDIDRTLIYLDRRELADFLGNTMRFSQVLVRTSDYDLHAEQLGKDLAERLYEARLTASADPSTYGEVTTWEDQRRNMLRAIANERTLLGVMLSLVLAVAGFTIFAILSMMVSKKRRDIGILTALGATPGGIMRLFLFIGFWDGLLGSILGATLGILGALNIDGIEMWLSTLIGWQIFDRTIYIFDYIPAIVVPGHVISILVGAFLCTLLFAVVPAWRAARLHPIDALRYE